MIQGGWPSGARWPPSPPRGRPPAVGTGGGSPAADPPTGRTCRSPPLPAPTTRTVPPAATPGSTGAGNAAPRSPGGQPLRRGPPRPARHRDHHLRPARIGVGRERRQRLAHPRHVHPRQEHGDRLAGSRAGEPYPYNHSYVVRPHDRGRIPVRPHTRRVIGVSPNRAPSPAHTAHTAPRCRAFSRRTRRRKFPPTAGGSAGPRTGGGWGGAPAT